ncbi:hypothetical protein F5Y18DRAFT_367221 [Xylariaceae sp. FL1019]|nr:hypothetical protein F5Y18DRAFT_367221 [Xylariaceae sp. FL1019]
MCVRVACARVMCVRVMCARRSARARRMMLWMRAGQGQELIWDRAITLIGEVCLIPGGLGVQVGAGHFWPTSIEYR